MTQLISFFMAIIFAIEMFFMGLFPSDSISFTQTDNSDSFYVNGESENGLLRYGVAGDINLFEPGEEITVVIECRDNNLEGEQAKISLKSEQADINKRGYIVFDADNPYSMFSFSSEKPAIPCSIRFFLVLFISHNKEIISSDHLFPVSSVFLRRYLMI